MGGSNGSNGGSSEIGQYNQQRKAAEQGIDIMLDARTANVGRRNEELASDLERRAKETNFLGQKAGSVKIGNIDVRPSSFIPGGMFLNYIQRKNFENMAAEIRRGGKPITEFVNGTEFVRGVMRDGVYSGDDAFNPNRNVQGDDNDTTSPEVTPERTAEIVPDDKTLQTKTIMEQTTRGTRRTRRAGQAGTILEGYGALTRGKGSRSVV